MSDLVGTQIVGFLKHRLNILTQGEAGLHSHFLWLDCQQSVLLVDYLLDTQTGPAYLWHRLYIVEWNSEHRQHLWQKMKP